MRPPVSALLCRGHAGGRAFRLPPGGISLSGDLRGLGGSGGAPLRGGAPGIAPWTRLPGEGGGVGAVPGGFHQRYQGGRLLGRSSGEAGRLRGGQPGRAAGDPRLLPGGTRGLERRGGGAGTAETRRGPVRAAGHPLPEHPARGSGPAGVGSGTGGPGLSVPLRPCGAGAGGGVPLLGADPGGAGVAVLLGAPGGGTPGGPHGGQRDGRDRPAGLREAGAAGAVWGSPGAAGPTRGQPERSADPLGTLGWAGEPRSLLLLPSPGAAGSGHGSLVSGGRPPGTSEGSEALSSPRCASCPGLPLCNGNLRARASGTGRGFWGEDPGCYLSGREIREILS